MKVIPKSTLNELARNIGRDQLGKTVDSNMLYQYLCHCPGFEGNDGEYYCRVEDVNGLIRNFILWVENKDFSYLKRKRGYRTNNVPDIHEFIESDKYMNMPGYMFPAVKEALWELWHGDVDYVEAILTGSTFTGKSFMLECSMQYMCALTYFLHDPQAELDLAPGTPLYVALQAGSYDQAKKILFRPIVRSMRLTKFFREVFPFNPKVESELLFPNGVIMCPFAGGDDSVLGLTILGGGITEMNRMSFVKESRRSGANKERTYDQAVKLYDTLVRRMTARTMQLGKLWGKIIVDAASEHSDDFTSKRIKQVEQLRQENRNYHVYIYRKTQWEVASASRYRGKKFLVETGDEMTKARIIRSKKDAIYPERVIEIPEDLRVHFETDIDGALREYAGIVHGADQPAIPYRENVGKGIEEFKQLYDGEQLFRVNDCVLQHYKGYDAEGRLAPEWDRLINQEFLDGRADPNVKYCLHCDPSLKHDAMGIAVGRLLGWQQQPKVKVWNARRREWEEKSDMRAPRIVIDGLLRVIAPPGDEVDLLLTQMLVIHLSQILNLGLATIDSYQSAQMIQAWKEVGIACGPLSVDDTPEPYTRFKLAYRDCRLITPDHPAYPAEVSNLIFDGKKFDHMPQGSKDLSDCVAAVTYLIETHITDYVPTDQFSGKEAREMQRRPGQRRGRRISMLQ